jgi:hypothetical protein
MARTGRFSSVDCAHCEAPPPDDERRTTTRSVLKVRHSLRAALEGRSGLKVLAAPEPSSPTEQAMQITDILAQMGGLQSMARELGVSEDEAASGAAALAPAILGGFSKQAQAQPAGANGLGDLLQRLGGGGLLDQVLAPQPTDVSPGNDVLGQIFGSKDVSRAVAQHAASQSGLAPGLLQKMLPMLAMLISGYMARQHSAGASATQSLRSLH